MTAFVSAWLLAAALVLICAAEVLLILGGRK